MKYEYDDMHLHLDYFGDEYDVESIAYKRKQEDVWDVFFNFAFYGITPTGVQEDEWMDDYSGYRVFSVHANDLSWEFGSAKFEEWLLKHRILEKTMQK
ncbi:hypothetical protein CON65_22375 [Bacillus pseudomycoides]|uniref:DUF3986 domain-containing protein n=1 Tax=Bacillus pseudomycoides TaxID=64104 RepID=A0AA91V948_9BACI|nr:MULTISPECIES: DUF3986 family protein [Bacillus]PEB51167.1 hypothetical protein COO03_18475 [Bacillus sp. AFS098217]PED80509.1 hypothetical protein CON65_22375 [Bacillus pseudomycoides]PEU16577.1 hypothetical protein CN524_04325 [Bacillus sp. AFS019443]PEU18928.1 hypothetical protein CN525_09215 [Bacillus sp. AFS014408]PFW65342.1 hypothetical protein COL20_01065 [Bacillus sp. AFS075034]